MTGVPRATRFRLLALIAVVAAAYYLSGRLGLLLAIPPGYATAVWPPSGIALAAVILGGARLAPGVALGSFLVNVGTSFDPATPVASSLVAAAIALGAAAQAGLGAWLIVRYVGYRNVLTQELAAVRMLALGGPVACLLNTVVAVGSLWLSGQVETGALLSNLGTWWVGDTIGVLIFTPLVLVWAVRPYRDWIQRQLLVTVPLAGLFAAVVTMFVFISHYEQARLMTEFERTARTLAREVRKDLGASLNSLNALEGLYASSDHVEAQEFDTFGRRLIAATPAIQALSWTPFVPAAQGGDAAGVKGAAGRRPFHAPVRYIAPAQGNEAVLGFDNASEPGRLAALEAARDSGSAAATPPVELVQGGAGILMYVPVFRDGARPQTVEARRSELRGFVVAILGLERFLRATTDVAARAGLSVELTDAGALRRGDASPDAGPELTGDQGFRQEIRLPFGGRDLRLAFARPSRALLARRSWATWTVMAGGLGLTAMVGMLLLLGVGREAHADALVRERTASLRLSEEQARHAAMHDHLTGLPNRALFLDRLQQAAQHGRRHSANFALLYLDIDGFKAINDQHGHATGDELLRQIARRLRESVRAEDTAARLGGDEFAVLLAGPIDEPGTLAKGRQLVATLGAPYDLTVPALDPIAARVGASVGVALFPDHGKTADDLVHAADEAMYQAKKGGKNTCKIAR